MFRLQFGNKAMSKDEAASLLSQAAAREDRQPRGGDAVRPLVARPASRGPMVHDGVNWRMKTRRARVDPVGGAVAVAGFRSFRGSCAKHHAHAQPQCRLAGAHHQSDGGAAHQLPTSRRGRTSASIPSRERRRGSTLAHARASTLPYARFSPNLYPACQYADRGPDGECFDRPSTGGGKGGTGKSWPRRAKGGSDNGNSQAAVNLRTVPNELVAEIDGALSAAEADELARRHGLERIASQNFPLIGGTIGLFRIIDRPSGRHGAPRIRRRRQRALGAVQFPLLPAGSRRSPRPRAIPRNMPSPSFGCRRRTRSPAA